MFPFQRCKSEISRKHFRQETSSDQKCSLCEVTKTPIRRVLCVTKRTFGRCVMGINIEALGDVRLWTCSSTAWVSGSKAYPEITRNMEDEKGRFFLRCRASKTQSQPSISSDHSASVVGFSAALAFNVTRDDSGVEIKFRSFS